MKKGLSILALVSTLFLGSTEGYAQSALTRANFNYENLAYNDALKIYEDIANKGDINPEILKHLGNSLYFNGDYIAANKWYSELFNKFGNEFIEPDYDYRYAKTLLSVGDEFLAEQYFKKYAKRSINSPRAKLISVNDTQKKSIYDNSGRYRIDDSKINSRYSDYVGSYFNNQVLFTSARDTGSFVKREFTWTGEPFSKIYIADIVEDGSLSEARLFSKEITTKLNESSPIVTKDGNTMYFTRNNYLGKRGYNSEHETLLKIYKAELIDGKWTNISELPFNSDQFSTAHPVLNTRENVMYFVSDRPGGFGKSDIWKVSLTGTEFGVPENLGPQINTDGRETFPFLTSDNELYFASDAREGFGGLDIYVLKILPDGSFTEIQNVGEPINSTADDFSFIIDKQSKKGFFSSNREMGYGYDDIYSFVEIKPLVLECLQELKVLVVDDKTDNVITKAYLQLTNIKGVGQAKVLDNFQYSFDKKFDCGAVLNIKAQMVGYEQIEESTTLGSKSGETVLTIRLKPKKVEVVKVPEVVQKKIKKNDDLFKLLNLKPIHFDLDKDNIRPDATLELAKIVEVMKEYPNMKIDVRSFTDSRGKDAYNMKLSERRAKATAGWIVSQGINSSRVKFKGYGETRLLNDCVNGVKCTEEEHAINRRSEFIVTDI